MQLDRYVDEVRHQLDVAAEAGGDEARTVAERLVAPLESAMRLALQDALADAAEEITLELAPGSVELRLRGREPEFVVTGPPTSGSPDHDGDAEDAGPAAWTRRPDVIEGADDPVARINLRLPERLKARVEQAAASEGLSINAWLVRTTAAAIDREPIRQHDRRTRFGGQRYQGWAR